MTQAAAAPIVIPLAAHATPSTYAATVSHTDKKAFGQYFTSAKCGTFVVSMSTTIQPHPPRARPSL